MNSFAVSAEHLGTLVGTALMLTGVMALRATWLKRQGGNRCFILLGWLLVTAGFVLLSHVWGGEMGITYGLMLLSVVAYIVVASGTEFRTSVRREPRDVVLEPDERPTNWSRAIAKSLLAIVLAGIASIGVGIAFAVAMPIATHDRMVIGGLLVPILWGGGMAWTLCDAKLVRATLVLLTVSAIGYGIAFLPKALS